ncbi:MAG: class B sortase [Lachnospiraceae bacterium]|nr:class B sortase [Lachnospiraceae bacterium]
MRSRKEKVVLGILLVIVLITGAMLLRNQLQSMEQRRRDESLAAAVEETTVAAATESAVSEEEESEPYHSPIDFESLRQQNPDTVGWIRIPDTRVDYPIVQTADNNKYLHTDFEGKESVYGAVYLDFESKVDFSGWNNPLYGHNMKDGSMFKDVVKFKDKEFFENHRYLEIYTPERTIHLKTVACYYSDASGIVRQTRFKSQESFDAWVEERLSPCSFAEMPEASVGSMFVLVTCSYEMNDARTLLYAVEVDENGEMIPAKS